MKLLDFLHQTKTQAILAFLVLFGVGGLLELGHLSEGLNNRILDIALLTATFYFGGSKSSTSKDETIKSMADNIASTPATTTTGDININPTTNDNQTVPGAGSSTASL